MSVLRVENLGIDGRTPAGRWIPVVRDVNLTVQRGEVVALIGESGAGKSTVALAAMGHTRPGTRVVAGRVVLGGIDLLAARASQRRKMRGVAMAYVAQSAQAALNPAITIGEQVAEPLLIHRIATAGDARRRVTELLRRLDLPSPITLAKRFPHQVSGGQQQRVMVAMALTCSPGLLILDEPTTALDVTTQIEVLKTIKDALRDNGSAAIYVSHDLPVVTQIADRIIVMRAGGIVEEGTTADIIGRPREAYTRRLIDAFAPHSPARRDARGRSVGEKPLLEITRVSSTYKRAPLLGKLGAEANVLQDVTLDVRPREVVAVVGESGSGKSTLARVVVGLQPISSGQIRFEGHALAARARRRDRDAMRRIQIVPQSADLSLNPGQRIVQSVGRPLELYFGLSGQEKSARIAELLAAVGLPADYAGRYPAELSGGQRQRVSIARALAAKPEIIICDEILSSLDALVAGQILELLQDLRRDHNVAYLFISHDIATVSSFADRVLVLYAGRVCEIGPPAAVFRPPHHPYTALLLSSVPMLQRGWLEEVAKRRPLTQASTAASAPKDEGCAFRTRCPMAIPGMCDKAPPPPRPASFGQVIHCHRPIEELAHDSREERRDSS